MSWPKFSDNYGHDCWTLSDQAFRLHTEAICWNGQKLLDCIIPKDDLRRFAKHPAAVAELLAVGYWTDEGDTYRVVHHSEHQRTREEAVKLQERNRQNGAKGGRPPKSPKPRNNPDGNPDGNPEGEERSGKAHLGEGSSEIESEEFCRICGGLEVESGCSPMKCQGEVG